MTSSGAVHSNRVVGIGMARPILRPTNPIEKTTPSGFFRCRWITFRDPLADENDRGPVTI
ncbi:hypothetical protein JCM18918_1572 [Cutibacterium acnes JCM 18918]|nr:hypothetical protein JCM18918_1572 [Cutibacterium acnes JCM 18918]